MLEFTKFRNVDHDCCRVVAVSFTSSKMDPNIFVRGISEAYTNIVFLHLDLTKRLKNTPLEGPCKMPRSNTSDVRGENHERNCFRLVTLYKYGGWYLDNKLLTLKPLDMFRNATTIEWHATEPYENFMAFDAGHRFLVDYMRHLAVLR